MQIISARKIIIFICSVVVLAAGVWVAIQFENSKPEPVDLQAMEDGMTFSLSVELTTIVEEIPGIDRSSIEMIPVDFNGDGTDECVAYFHQNLLTGQGAWNGESLDWNGAFRIYGFSDETWQLLYQDQGSVGGNVGVAGRMDGDNFFEATDLDEDGFLEAIITVMYEGTGATSEQYILKWDNGYLVRPEIVQSLTEEELAAKFLQPGEVFGRGEIGFVAICPPEEADGWCKFKSGAPNAIGQITHDFDYQDGKFVAVNYVRENFETPENNYWVTIGGGEGEFPDASDVTYRVHLPEYVSGGGKSELEIWDQEKLLGKFATPSVAKGDDTVFAVWTAFTTETSSGSESRIYFYDAAGCGGCVWGASYYVAINSATQKAELRQISEDETSPFGVERDRMAMSSSGKLVAFVPRLDDSETVWFYDLESESGMKVFDVPEEQDIAVIGDFMDFYLYLSWNGDTLHVAPVYVSGPGTPQAYDWTSDEGLVESVY